MSEHTYEPHVTLPKHAREDLRRAASRQGYSTVSAYLRHLIIEQIADDLDTTRAAVVQPRGDP